MKTLARISRLVAYFERKKDEKAIELSETLGKISNAKAILASLRNTNETVNRMLVTRQESNLDVEWIKLCEAFKFHLHNGMERVKKEITALAKEADVRRSAAEEAMKEHKIWEKIKERQEMADKEDRMATHQEALDTLSMQKKHRERSDSKGGSIRQEER